MRKFTFQFFIIGLLFTLCCNNSYAQQQSETVAVTGNLIRVTPKLADIDRTTMYGQPLVTTRDMDGRIWMGDIRKQFRENKAKLVQESVDKINADYLATTGGKKIPTIQQPQRSSNIQIPGTTLGTSINGQTSPGLQPTDNNMAAGPNHIIQTVNNTQGTQFTIWNKSGTLLQPATILASVTGVPGDGDPIVLYDQLADRWFLAEFGGSTGTNALIIAVSNTPNPTGSWSIYQWVDASFFPDYPKFSIWHNAYYAYTNDFTPPGANPYLGTSVWAFDRTAMLAGAATAQMLRQRVNGPGSFGPWGFMGTVGLEGMTPSSLGGLFVLPTSATQLGIFEVTPNFGAATLTVGPTTNMTVNPWNTSGAITQQAGPTLGSLSPRLMFKVNYRNNGGTESIVLAQTVGNGALAQVRWYELRRVAGVWTVFQQGDVPGADGNSRWMPGISMDGCGNIALMYNVAGNGSTPAHPSIRYTGRNSSDPLNTMTLPESVILNAAVGTGTITRWGDYNTTVQDYTAAGVPTNGSFWSTAQHSNQLTRVANFTLTGGCVAAPNITSGTSTLTAESCAPNNSVIDPGETVTVSFCASNVGTSNTANLVGTLQATGGVTSPSGPQNYGVVTFGGPAVCRSFSFTAAGACGSTITASIQMQDGATNFGTLTYTFTLGTTVVSSSQNFDAVVAPALPAGWVPSNPVGGGALWVTSTSGNPAPAFQSSPNSIFIDNPGIVTDKQIITPSFTAGAGARVSFANNFGLENTFDGGVLEISINGGAYQDIITAGGSFVSGGYTGIVSNGFGNPLGNRNTWTGASGGFITTTVNMPPAAAGLPCTLKFRMGSDNSFSDFGWRVDNFSVSQPACCTGIGNDACAFAPTINCGQTITGTTVGATADAVITCGTILNTAPGVWYKFTGDGTTVTLSLCGSAYDTKIGVFSGTCGALVCVTGNDDNIAACGGSGLQSQVTFVSVSGTDYFVLVTGFGSASGAFSLTRTCVGACTLTCPANITVNNTPNQCGAVVNYPAPTTSGTCGTVTGSPASGSFFPIGSTTVTVTSTAGPTCTFTVTVIDNQPPTITCPANVTVSCAAAVPAVNTSLVTATDNCPGRVVTHVGDVISAQTCANRYIITRTYRATDAAGLFTECTQTITVNDITAPTITACPAAVTVSCAAAVPAVNLAAVTATDNCTGVVVITHIGDVITAQTCANKYTLTRTYRATDVCGNFTNCVQVITVNDITAPVLICPANIAAVTPVGSCTAVVSFVPTATDNCAGAVTITSVPASGSAFAIGTTTVNVTATDVCGNSSTCSFLVTVTDGQLPTITAQPVNRTVCAGSSTTFNVTAVTTPNAGGPIAYQWQQWNGSAWVNVTTGTGATTAALTFANVSNLPQNTNTFRVVLTGLCTVVNSGAASLYINPLPTISLTASIPPILLPGQTLSITATVNPAGGSFVWFKNGVVIPGVTGGTLSGLTVDNLGTYRAVYTDPNGCVSTSADITVSGQPSNNLFVYPNPNTGVFQVRFYNTVNEAASVIIYDAKGARVYVQKFTTGIPYSRLDIDISRSPAGTYLVEVVNGAGKRIAAKRIVKQL